MAYFICIDTTRRLCPYGPKVLTLDDCLTVVDVLRWQHKQWKSGVLLCNDLAVQDFREDSIFAISYSGERFKFVEKNWKRQ